MIVVVAMIDDILSLVVLAVIEQLGGHKAIMSSEGHDAILASEPSDDADLEVSRQADLPRAISLMSGFL